MEESVYDYAIKLSILLEILSIPKISVNGLQIKEKRRKLGLLVGRI